MNIIHTADWHLGQTFFGYDRTHEHQKFLNWLCELLSSKKIDLLLIAGDLFDGPNPSAVAQRLFYKFIHKAVTENPTLQIIITAGNHDSATRLEAPNPLLENFNVHIRGVVKRNDNAEIDYDHFIVPIDKDFCCLAVPYLRNGDYAPANNHDEGLRNFYSELYNRAKEKYSKIIAMGHMHTSGAELSSDDRSERIIIGGLDCVDVKTFNDDIIYTALGHLHKAQRVSERENIRYAGAPLPMSFAERNNKQSVTRIAIEDDSIEIKQIEFTPPVRLISVPKSPLPVSQVIDELKKLPKGKADESSPYLEIRVLITEPEPTMRQLIEESIEGHAVRIARIEAVTEQKDDCYQVPMTYDELKKIEPLELAKDIYRRKYGQEEIPEKMSELLNNVIIEVLEERE